MKRLLFALPVLLFAGIVGYFAIGLTRDPSTLPSALIDKPAPAFDLPGLGTRQGLAAADLEGAVTVVNFFASWCAPCRVEHPLLMRLAREGRITLYGVAYKDRPEDSERFLAQLGDPYERIGVDRDGRVAIDFGVYGVPETYVLDKAGKIRYRHVGPLTPEAWRTEVAPLVQKLGES
jgi:cytochrome c biogenesis protein CcmG/thiol:disulfide interchange protein DsbE